MMAEKRAMLPWEQARSVVDAALVGEAPAPEVVPVRAACGRRLAADVHSRLELPPFDKSAMDGYAILPDDEREQYRLLETVAAGQTPTAALRPGTTVKVMTGAPVPDGAGVVVMREYAEQAGGTVRILRHGGKPNICRRGEDVRIGDRICPAGRRLRPVDVANLVACGLTEVPVVPRVRLAAISTGDEIADDPAELAPGKIMNSNGPMLALLAEGAGLEVVSACRVGDDLDQTAAALAAALEAADIAALSGGVSVGDFDYVLAAFERLGLEVHFSSVAIKPGRPTVFATTGRKAVFGLPGNPVSVYLMFHLFVLRAAGRLAGFEPPARQIRLPLAEPYRRRKAERMQFVPARLTPDGAVAPVEFHGSAHLLALGAADGFFAVPLGTKQVPAGGRVDFLPIGGLRDD